MSRSTLPHARILPRRERGDRRIDRAGRRVPARPRARAQHGRVAAVRRARARGARRAARHRDALRRPRAGRADRRARLAVLPASSTRRVVQSELRYREDGERDHDARRHRRRLDGGRHHGLGRARARATRPGCTPARSAAAISGPRCWRRWRTAGASSRSTRRARCGGPRWGRSCSAATLDAELLRHVQALKLSEHEALAAYGTVDAAAIRALCGVPEVLVTFGEWGADVASGRARAGSRRPR